MAIKLISIPGTPLSQPSQHWCWPAANSTATPNVIAFQSGVISVAATSVGGGGQMSSGSWDGVACQFMRCFAVGDSAARDFGPVATLTFRTGAAGHLSERTPDPQRCWRVKVIMGSSAFSANTATKDMGFELARSGNGGGLGILANTNGGIGLLYVDANTIRLISRTVNGAALNTFDITFPGNSTALHTFDFRFQGASAADKSRFQLLVDDSPIALPAAWQTHDAGTVLPGTDFQGLQNCGLLPRLVNTSGNAFDNSLIARRLEIWSGYTLDHIVNDGE